MSDATADINSEQQNERQESEAEVNTASSTVSGEHASADNDAEVVQAGVEIPSLNSSAPAVIDLEAASNIPISDNVAEQIGNTAPVVDPATQSTRAGSDQGSQADGLLEWGIDTLKTAKQFMSEQLFKGTYTVNTDTERSVEGLRAMQKKYAGLLKLVRNLASNFSKVVETQKLLRESFASLAQKSPELYGPSMTNYEIHKAMAKDGDNYLDSLRRFVSSLQTFCSKTLEDTNQTVKNCDSARLQYDTFRVEYEALKALPAERVPEHKLLETHKKLETHKIKFERLCADVQTKINLLTEQEIKLLSSFRYLTSGYFNGYASALLTSPQSLGVQPDASQSTE